MTANRTTRSPEKIDAFLKDLITVPNNFKILFAPKIYF
jgi:hypothetical protein